LCGALGRLFATGRVVSFKPLFPAEGKPRRANAVVRFHAAMASEPDPDYAGLGVLAFASREDAKKAAKALAADPDVRFAHFGAEKQTLGTIDPLRNRQWGLTAIQLGQFRAPSGYDFGRDVKVGVIDTGVDTGHPDLVDADIDEQRFNHGRWGDQDGHGTHVIGTIAAVANNNVGITGVCRSRRLISMKALDPFSQTGYFRALRHAVDEHVQVLNLGLAGPATPTEQKLIKKAIRQGTIVVAAMGNQGSCSRCYPAAYRGVFAVGASTQADQHWRHSNRGAHIDLVAPGVSILSTVPHQRKGRRARHKGYDAEGWDGTSMAAAFVTGAVALCLALKPDATLRDVRRALHNGADRVDGQTGFTHRMGWGRLNVPRTLSLLGK
jgi:subtilisin family serine protease